MVSHSAELWLIFWWIFFSSTATIFCNFLSFRAEVIIENVGQRRKFCWISQVQSSLLYFYWRTVLDTDLSLKSVSIFCLRQCSICSFFYNIVRKFYSSVSKRESYYQYFSRQQKMDLNTFTNNVDRMYWVFFSLLPIGQQRVWEFSQAPGACLPFAERACYLYAKI